jgi:hypothetical protein
MASVLSNVKNKVILAEQVKGLLPFLNLRDGDVPVKGAP